MIVQNTNFDTTVKIMPAGLGNTLSARLDVYENPQAQNLEMSFVILKMLDRKYLPSNFPKVKAFKRLTPNEADTFRLEALTMDIPSLQYLIAKSKKGVENISTDLRVFIQLKGKKKLVLMTDYPDVVFKNIGLELHNQNVMRKLLEKALKKKVGQKKANKVNLKGKRK